MYQTLEPAPGDQFLRGLTGLMAPRQLSDAQMPIDAEARSRLLPKLSTSQRFPRCDSGAANLIIKRMASRAFINTQAAGLLKSCLAFNLRALGYAKPRRPWPSISSFSPAWLGNPSWWTSHASAWRRLLRIRTSASVLPVSYSFRLHPVQVETTFTTHFLEKTPQAEVGPPGHGSSAE